MMHGKEANFGDYCHFGSTLRLLKKKGSIRLYESCKQGVTDMRHGVLQQIELVSRGWGFPMISFWYPNPFLVSGCALGNPEGLSEMPTGEPH